MTRKTKYEVSYQRKRFFVSAKTDFSFCFGSFGVMLSRTQFSITQFLAENWWHPSIPQETICLNSIVKGKTLLDLLCLTKRLDTWQSACTVLTWESSSGLSGSSSPHSSHSQGPVIVRRSSRGLELGLDSDGFLSLRERTEGSPGWRHLYQCRATSVTTLQITK